MLYFPTSIRYHDENKDKTVLAWHSKMKGSGLEQDSRTTLSVSMLLSLYACKSASPEDLSARIVERKYVLTLHIQLTLSVPSTWVTKMPFPQATVTQSKFLRRLPLLSMFHSLEHITFPNWVFLVAHFTRTITFILISQRKQKKI